jgi:hypothetical protein
MSTPQEPTHDEITEEAASWPDAVRETDPGRKAGIGKRREWLDSHRELAEHVQQKRTRSLTRTPQPDDGATPERGPLHPTDVEW